MADAFMASEYATWRIDDIDYILRNGVETIYVIEVEGEKDGVRMDVDLYYTEDGVLVKEVIDAEDDYDYRDFIPSAPSSGIEAFISERYPDARIVDMEREDGGIEVDIVDGRKFRELYFDRSEIWLMTKTEIRYTELPEAVSAVLGQQYSDYRIDDIDYYETSDNGNFYRIELESMRGDMTIDIDPEGNVAEYGSGSRPERPGYGEGGQTDSAVLEFIETKYPGAAVREMDYDDGYLQVEIWHEGKEKDVYFNGRYEWVKTEWDVRYGELPDAVLAVLDSEYASYHVDDLTFVQTPDAEYYMIEMEGRGDREIHVRITPEGNVL